MKTAKEIIMRVEQLKADRSPWENYWQEAALFSFPRRADFYTDERKGRSLAKGIFTSIAKRSTNRLAGAVHGIVANPSTIWHGLTSGSEDLDERDDIGKWLETSNEVLSGIFRQSNFQSELPKVLKDLIALGTAPLLVEDDKQDIVRFSSNSVSNVLIEQNSRGAVDACYRRMRMTAEQAADKFGRTGLPREILTVLRSGKEPTRKFDIIHAVFPRTGAGVVQKAVGSKRPYASVYLCEKPAKIIKVDGFYELPWAVPRWDVASGEIYGRGPVDESIEDIRLANVMTRDILKALQKIVDPALTVADKSFAGGRKVVNTKPGGINVVRPAMGSRPPIDSLPLGGDPKFVIDYAFNLEKIIEKSFYVDDFQLAERPNMTATEVLQRTEQRLQSMGPHLGRLQNELLSVIVRRTFNIANRRGEIPPPPEGLSAAEVKFDSPIAKAQRSSELQSFMQTLDIVGAMAEYNPNTTDNVDFDEVTRGVWMMNQVRADWLRDADGVEEIRKTRQEQQEQMQQMQMAQMGADAVGKVAGAAKQNS